MMTHEIKTILTSKKIRVNREITAPELKVIDEAGKQLGVLKLGEAQKIAREKNLDLVEVASAAKPPIAKLMNYGQYQYRLIKQQKKSRAKSKKIETKGIRIGYRTGEHDLQFKADQATKFLKEGHRLKIELVLRGREKGQKQMAFERLDDFIKNMIKTKTVIVQQPKFIGFGIVTVLTADRDNNTNSPQ